MNDQVKSVIWQAAKSSIYSKDGQNHYREYDKNDEGHYAILESVNGANCLRLLRDHDIPSA